ncbi:MAG TPA: gluconate 2-dehydrogenase subunit 3 family protein [Solirubrobacteraceae bacterium]|jgi:Gluconate 2-dehydrogenase subunit 3|nr:gluconate 2-dehydrogenase subunit 3 family protein [Solirubrobacteraceae bacterium]
MSSGFREPGHLPNLRPDRQPAHPDRLPRQQAGVTPQMYGRYPHYDVLAEAPHWDEVTRRLVLDRVEKVPDIRFFSDGEARTLGVFCDLVLAQDKEPRVPVLNMIDAKLFAGQLDGFRYADMPDDRETWRQVAKGLDAAARQHGSDEFATAPWTVQCEVIEAFSKGSLHGQVWDELPAKRAWSVVMRAVLSVFYSHPWAWNEIGFGGPAYPRGFARFGVGQREHWEGAAATGVDPVKDVKEQGLE